jgi:hypothetical protein
VPEAVQWWLCNSHTQEVQTLIRVPKPALILLSGLLVVAASACSSSGATAAPAGPGAGSSQAMASIPAAGGNPTVNPQDPSAIITQALSGGTAVKSFHIKFAMSGTIKAAVLSEAAGSAGGAAGGIAGALKGDLKLDGTSIEGDVDIANQAGHITFNYPAGLAAAGGAGSGPLTGDIIVVNGTLYYKISMTGPKYMKMDLGSLGSLAGGLTGSLPSALPTAGGSAMSGLTDQLSSLRQAMDQAGAKATLVGVEQIGGQDAYHINVSVPLDMINSQIAAAAAKASAMPAGLAAIKIDSASIDFWFYKDSYRPAQFELKGASSAIGNLDLMVTISAYDQPVTITAPAADQVQAAP